MSNSGFIAAMGGVSAAIFFVAAVICGMASHPTNTSRIMFVIALVLSSIYLFVSLFWGVRATMLEGHQVARREEED
ncbi:MAG: hypothetical protein BIFFINMI_04306 [Phycisphaerae bacterium]|nr:hypothetical protein [Phycisphaerae bacterium]